MAWCCQAISHYLSQWWPYPCRLMASLGQNGLSHTWTHWGRVTHICVGNLNIIGSDNGLSPGWRQAIIWTNAGILLIWPLGTNFSEISIDIQTFSCKKIHFKMSSGKWWPFCLGLNVCKHTKDIPYLTITGEISSAFIGSIRGEINWKYPECMIVLIHLSRKGFKLWSICEDLNTALF